MTSLPYDRYCDEIIEQTRLLRGHLTGVNLATTVPTCPEWTLRELAVHVGAAHRWAALIVESRAAEPVDPKAVPEVSGPRDDDAAALDAWLADGAALLAGHLRAAGPGTGVWSWAWQRDSDFWARRMAHETVVHRADAALATGVTYEVAPEVAADAVDEWLDVVRYVQRAGLDERAAELRGAGRSLHLHATDAPAGLDAEWLIEFGEEEFTWRRGHDKATVALRGPLTDVLLTFYRRLPPDAGGVEVLGERELLDFWLERASFG